MLKSLGFGSIFFCLLSMAGPIFGATGWVKVFEDDFTSFNGNTWNRGSRYDDWDVPSKYEYTQKDGRSVLTLKYTYEGISHNNGAAYSFYSRIGLPTSIPASKRIRLEIMTKWTQNYSAESPSFWMLTFPYTGWPPEIDMFEGYGQRLNCSVHSVDLKIPDCSYKTGANGVTECGTTDEISNDGTQWKVYGLEVCAVSGQESLVWTRNQEVLRTLSGAPARTFLNEWGNLQFMIILGGGFGLWAGTPPMGYTTYHWIDYFRAYSWGDGAVQPPPANTPPTCSFATPANGASLTAPANVSVTVNASDADGSISKVDLYKNDVLVRSEATGPYNWNVGTTQDAALQNLAAGTYTLKAIATDNSGATTSSIIAITVKSGATHIQINKNTLDVNGQGESNVQIINLRGQVVQSVKVIGNRQMSLDGLSPGVYQVMTQTTQGITYQKMVR